MKLENQVVSLELAKKLKELGVKQESLFYWLEVRDNFDVKPTIYYGKKREDKSGTYKATDGSKWEEENYSAFTVAELGEILPDHFHTQKSGIDFFIECKDRLHKAYGHYEFASTEADTKAKMLIYLLENNLING